MITADIVDRQVVHALRRGPRRRAVELADALDLEMSAIRAALRRLRRAGKVRRYGGHTKATTYVVKD